MYGGNDLYMQRVSTINILVGQLEDLYKENIRFRRGLNQVRDISYIKKDILEKRNELGSQLFMLNGDRKEITYTCTGCCEQALDYQHELLRFAE